MKKIFTFAWIALTSLTAVAGEMTHEQRVTAMNCLAEGREDCPASSAIQDEGERIDAAAMASDRPQAVAAITTEAMAKKER